MTLELGYTAAEYARWRDAFEARTPIGLTFVDGHEIKQLTITDMVIDFNTRRLTVTLRELRRVPVRTEDPTNG